MLCWVACAPDGPRQPQPTPSPGASSEVSKKDPYLAQGWSTTPRRDLEGLKKVVRLRRPALVAYWQHHMLHHDSGGLLAFIQFSPEDAHIILQQSPELELPSNAIVPRFIVDHWGVPCLKQAKREVTDRSGFEFPNRPMRDAKRFLDGPHHYLYGFISFLGDGWVFLNLED